MSYRSRLIGRLYIAWWTGPELGDADAVIADLRRARAAQGSVLFVTFMTRDSAPPGDGVRREFMGRLDTLVQLVDHAYAVVDGEGITSTLNRAVVRAMATLSKHRQKMSICASIDDVLNHAGEVGARREDVRAAIAQLKASSPSASTTTSRTL